MITVEQFEARLWELDMLDESLTQIVAALESEPMWSSRSSLPDQLLAVFQQMEDSLKQYRESREVVMEGAAKLRLGVPAMHLETAEGQALAVNGLESLEKVLAQYQPTSIGLTQFLNAVLAQRGAEPYVFVPSAPSSPSLLRVFVYSSHALEGMRRRRIHKNQVEKAVLNHDRLTEDASRNRWVAERDTSAGNFIRVVYAETPSGIEIVTTVITAIRITP